MKKLFFAFAAGLLLLAGCAKEYDDTALKESVASLDKRVTALESQMKALSSVIGADGKLKLIKSQQEIKENGKVVGYTVTFVSGETVSFKVDVPAETDPATVVGIKNDNNGIPWITVGGEPKWPLAEVAYLDVDENGYLTFLDQNTGVKIWPSLFKNLEYTEEGLFMTFFDGSSLLIPAAAPFALVLDSDVAIVTAEMAEVKIGYQVVGANETTVVDGFADGIYSFDGAKEGKLVFGIDKEALFVAKGHAVVWANNGEGLTDIRKITFGGTEVADVQPADKPEKPEDAPAEYDEAKVAAVAEAAGGEVAVSVTSNVEVKLVSDAEWITVGETKATKYTATCTLLENDSDAWRFGNVKVMDPAGAVLYQTIQIAQKPGKEAVKVIKFNNTIFRAEIPEERAVAKEATLEAWVHASDLSGCQNIMGTEGAFFIRFDGGKLQGRVATSVKPEGDAKAGELKIDAAGKLASDAFQVDKWQHVALTYVQGGKIALYLDGNMVAESTASDMPVYIDGKKIDATGAYPNYGLEWRFYVGGGEDKHYFKGSIFNARVWDKALSAEEIAKVKASSNVTGDNLLAYWKFDEGNGNAIKDYSESKLDLVSKKSNGANPAALEDTDINWIKGALPEIGEEAVVIEKAGGAETGFAAADFSANGAYGWFVFENAIDLSKGFTYVFHYYQNAEHSGKLGNFCDKMGGDWINMIRFNEGNIGGNAFGSFAGPVTPGRSNFNHKETAAEIGKWHQAAIVWDPSDNYLYKMAVDCSFKNGIHDQLNVPAPVFKALEIGDSWSPKSFNGMICEVSVWDKALTEKELYAIYGEIQDPANVENLKAYWPMHEGSGSKFVEATGKYEDIDFAKAQLEGDSNGQINAEAIKWVKGNEWEVVEEPQDPVPGFFDSNVKWVSSTDNKAYVNNVLNVVYGETTYKDVPNVKLGTSSKAGSFNVTLPAGTTKLDFWGIGWNGKDGALKITVGEQSANFTVKKNSGANNNSPYTVTITDEDKYTLTLDAALAEDTDIKIETTSTTAARAFLFGMVASAGAPVPPEPTYTDLSAEKANCYVITAPGAYKFPAVKGEGSESVGAVDGAELLWETYNNAEDVTANSVIAKVGVKDGFITFETPATLKPGNALIAAKSGETILWSWHIWIPATTIESSTYGYIFNHELMDRNLGALVAATPSNVPVESFGLQYEWGRKDPFPGALSISDNHFAKVSGKEMSIGYEMTLEQAIANPTTYAVYTEADSWGNWMSPENDANLWKDSEKTIYDPCPAGYRVPMRNTAQPLHSSDLSKVKGWSDNEASGDNAPYFTLGEPATVFPYGGLICENGKYIDHLGARSFIWTAHAIAIMDVRLNGAHTLNSTVTGRGCTVRCVKVEEVETPEQELVGATGVVLDGQFSEWANADAISTESSRMPYWKFGWDNDNLYFHYKITKSRITYDESGDYGYNSYIYVGLDTDNNAETGSRVGGGTDMETGGEVKVCIFPWRGNVNEGTLSVVNGVDGHGWIQNPVGTTLEDVHPTVYGAFDGDYCYLEVGIPRSALGQLASKIAVAPAMDYSTTAKTVIPVK